MLNKNNYSSENDLPLGISMALGQNPLIFGMFDSLTPAQRESFVSSAKYDEHTKAKSYPNGVPMVYDEPIERRRFE